MVVLMLWDAYYRSYSQFFRRPSFLTSTPYIDRTQRAMCGGGELLTSNHISRFHYKICSFSQANKLKKTGKTTLESNLHAFKVHMSPIQHYRVPDFKGLNTASKFVFFIFHKKQFLTHNCAMN